MKSRKSRATTTADGAAQTQPPTQADGGEPTIAAGQPAPQPKFKRDLPEASAQRPVLIRSVPIAGFHGCCRCGRDGFVNGASDGHLYCRPCAGELVEAGQAQVGGYATVAPHSCQKEGQA